MASGPGYMLAAVGGMGGVGASFRAARSAQEVEGSWWGSEGRGSSGSGSGSGSGVAPFYLAHSAQGLSAASTSVAAEAVGTEFMQRPSGASAAAAAPPPPSSTAFRALADVLLLTSDGAALPAHRAILAARSPLLAQRLAAECTAVAGTGTGGLPLPPRTARAHPPTLFLADLTLATAAQLLEWLYTDQLRSPVPLPLAQGSGSRALGTAAVTYGLPGLAALVDTVLQAPTAHWSRQYESGGARVGVRGLGALAALAEAAGGGRRRGGEAQAQAGGL